MNQLPILNICAKFELNWLITKKLWNASFSMEWAELGLKLEMTSNSDNVYDVTSFCVVLRSSWPILYSYQVAL